MEKDNSALSKEGIANRSLDGGADECDSLALDVLEQKIGQKELEEYAMYRASRVDFQEYMLAQDSLLATRRKKVMDSVDNHVLPFVEEFVRKWTTENTLPIEEGEGGGSSARAGILEGDEKFVESIIEAHKSFAKARCAQIGRDSSPLSPLDDASAAHLLSTFLGEELVSARATVAEQKAILTDQGVKLKKFKNIFDRTNVSTGSSSPSQGTGWGKMVAESRFNVLGEHPSKTSDVSPLSPMGADGSSKKRRRSGGGGGARAGSGKRQRRDGEDDVEARASRTVATVDPLVQFGEAFMREVDASPDTNVLTSRMRQDVMNPNQNRGRGSVRW